MSSYLTHVWFWLLIIGIILITAGFVIWIIQKKVVWYTWTLFILGILILLVSIILAVMHKEEGVGWYYSPQTGQYHQMTPQMAMMTGSIPFNGNPNMAVMQQTQMVPVANGSGGVGGSGGSGGGAVVITQQPPPQQLVVQKAVISTPTGTQTLQLQKPLVAPLPPPQPTTLQQTTLQPAVRPQIVQISRVQAPQVPQPTNAPLVATGQIKAF